MTKNRVNSVIQSSQKLTSKEAAKFLMTELEYNLMLAISIARNAELEYGELTPRALVAYIEKRYAIIWSRGSQYEKSLTANRN